jgi:hypothetical protein
MNDVVQDSCYRDVDQHFAGRSQNVRSIYDAVLRAAHSIGNFVEDPKKTSIHLNRRSAFAGITTRRDHLVLTLKAASDIEDSRISKREQVSANRWHHQLKLAAPREVDQQVIEWLRAAYDISG